MRGHDDEAVFGSRHNHVRQGIRIVEVLRGRAVVGVEDRGQDDRARTAPLEFVRGLSQPSGMSPIAEVATNLLAEVRCLRPKRSHDAQHEVARLVCPLELDAVPDAAHILKVGDDVDFPLREEATAVRWASRVVSGRSIDNRERIGGIVGRDAHRNELTAVVRSIAELDNRGMTPVMFLEQSARHLRRLRHHLDGVEQRERTDVEARRGRLLLAFIPPLEDRAELLVVTNDDSVTGLAQRRHPLG